MEPIRAFIAIELPGELKQALRNIQSRLKAGGQFPVKWADPQGIHLTLKFLGDIAADSTEEITRTIAEAVQGTSPLRLEVRELGVFPNPRRVQVIWVGVSGDVEPLSRLQQHIDSRLSPLGFLPETRRFTPHLTLARVRDRASPEERQSLGQLVSATRFETGYSFIVDSIHLMRSQLTREGPIYSRIGSVRLK